MTLPILYSQRRDNTRLLAISFLMQQAVENPGCISLAAGLVDSETLPLKEVGEAVAQVLANPQIGKSSLQYGTTQGSDRLRRRLLAHFAQLEGVSPEELGITADQLIATTGSQQLLSLVCEVLFDPGDICLVAGPTYFVFAGNLAGVGARSLTIPADENGMQADALEAALSQINQMQELHRVKLIYVVSDYDNPSGVCVSTQRREQIVNIAKKWSKDHRILVLEDAAYRELRYDGDLFPSIWSFDKTHEHVIYAQTFSKTFSPGIRVGYGIVPKDLVQALCDRKGNEDFGSANFNQHLMATVLEQRLYTHHLEDVKRGYTAKRDAMLAAADEYFSDIDGVNWYHPHGGLYVWMSLPEHIATGFESPLFKSAVEEGVMYVPGELCYASCDSRPSHQMRLSYGVQTCEGIRLGMQRLANAVRKTITQSPEDQSS